MRIPIWPGVRLSVWEQQNPEAVRVVMPGYHKAFTVRRALSKRGWMFLYIRYDWRDRGTPEPEDRSKRPLVAELTQELHRRVTHLDTIRGADGDTVPNEVWMYVSGEVLGLQGALGMALGGQVAGGDADRRAQEHYKMWAAECASEWNRCRCEACLPVLEGKVGR